MPIKRGVIPSYYSWLLTAVTITLIFSLFFLFRWKYGFRISAPSIKRSWSMAADQRGSTSTAPAPSRPARPGCPSCGRWTKAPKCTQTITWTVLVTGIQTTTTTLTRTRCPGLRWCEWTVLLVALTSQLNSLWKAWSQNCFKCVFLIDFVNILCVRFESRPGRRYIF